MKRVMDRVSFQQLLMKFMNVVYGIDPKAGVCVCCPLTAASEWMSKEKGFNS